ncbi:class II fructose-bisphosphate aldolase [Deinococcus peraridilitoris]|uniref:Ketose-bisphosphate aldolase n=1 Tax=Deinococcus peraridilitoris (strain DSM 19664 / LMG 22246 / CIP 109416 / KR-200) TaxID=937777 RepID=K9ZVT7_DEIPD|nr:class II fructose-bisphosphate aldolase [Deinococcus peraridilitoris]AFZ65646.1 ketose-bisphosphate aldolase [Deinococcus peraridilitoris DSM 19664]
MKLPQALTLTELLLPAQRHGYAVAAFSARYRACVKPVLQAAVELRSPVIVEISQRELGWFGLSPRDFRDAVEEAARELRSDVPLCLHLDHSWDFEVIRAAIEAGFSSVMIDASAQDFEENIRQTRRVVEFAHAHNVSVEAELGKLTTTDQMETDGDEALYTVPEEAQEFVERSGCDVLAVSIGTAHGVYPVQNPKIDFERLAAIRRLLPETPLVLHGGSGLPAETVHRAIELPGGGISKMNIATDLENAMLSAMGGLKRMTSADLDQLEPDLLAAGLNAVKDEARDKIQNFVRSAGRAQACPPART